MYSKNQPIDMQGHITSTVRWLPIAAVLFLALIFRLFALTGDIQYDPAVYAQYAHNIIDGTFTLATDCWYAHRLPVFVPAAFAYSVLGVSKISTSLWTLLLSLLQIGTVLWLGYRWLGREVAILGAIFLALLPLDVIWAGVLGPDEVIAAFVTFSAAMWILGWEAREKHSSLLFFLSGVFLAMASATRLYALLMVFFFAGHALWRRRSARSLFSCGLGMIAVGIPILLIYLISTGDILLPLKAAFGFYAAPERSEGVRLLFYPSQLWHIRSEVGIFPLLFSVAAMFALVRPSRKRLLLFAWMAPLFIYLQFGSMSLESYVPVFKRVRFLTPLAAPAALLIALVILEEMPSVLGKLRIFTDSGRTKGFLLIAMILLFGVNSLWIVAGHKKVGSQVASNFARAAAVLRSDRKLPIYFDHWRTAIRFEYYFGFEEASHLYEGADETSRMNRERAEANSRLGYLKWYKNVADIPDGFVVLEDEILAEAEKASAGDPRRLLYPAKDIPAYCENPPAIWKFLGRFGTIRLFRTRN